MGKLEGKVTLIIGASRGIGLAVAHRFASEGAEIWMTGREGGGVEHAAQGIGPAARTILADPASLEDLERVFATLRAHHGRLDVLYLSAAVTSLHLESEAATPEQFDEVFAVNVRGAFFAVQHALALMQGGGSIVVTGSVSTSRGLPGQVAYSASKAALRSMARTWSVELADRGVRVNCLSPGVIDSGEKRDYDEAARSAIRSRIPLQRFGDPGEVASAAVFLASDDSSFVTGAELIIDGGVTQT